MQPVNPADAPEPVAPPSGTADGPAPRRRPLPGRLIYVVCIGTAAIWALLDQATKVLAVELLSQRGLVDAGVGGWLEWNLVRNPNAAFGIPGFPGMFIIVTLVVLVLIAKTLPRTDRLALGFAYGLVAGGAVGNALDRVFRPPGFPEGAVVDFIKVGWWPTFNVADSGIVTGAVLIILLLLLADREERERERVRRSHRSVRPPFTGLPGALE
jgi:signal peptidase II